MRNVGKLATYGEQSEQIWITSSLDRLSQYFADPLRVIQALQQRNIIQSSGSLEAGQAQGAAAHHGAVHHARTRSATCWWTSRAPGSRSISATSPTWSGATRTRPSWSATTASRACCSRSRCRRARTSCSSANRSAAVFDRLETVLPPDLQLDLVANQPAVVERHAWRSLGHEFLLAIVAVILVTIILLPLRVAVIAAVAIPVTISTTLGVLNPIGVQLHQVSIAALIVVLGIVVDDAIVIADNYVDCWTAASRGRGRLALRAARWSSRC